MRTYKIVIQAVVTKTIEVQADTENEAYELAHDLFDVRCQSDYPERYEENTLSCVEVSK